MSPSDNIKRVLWYVFAGTKGGPTRMRIVEMLRKRPFNTNQLSNEMGMDYKTIQHHIKILEENRIIVPSNDRYGAVYFLSQLLEQTIDTFEEIKGKTDWEDG